MAKKAEKVERIISPEEQFEDNQLILSIDIPSRPATKKNHGIIIHVGKRHIMLPSPQYTAYEKLCKPFLTNVWAGAPIDYGIALKFTVWMDNWRLCDHTNLAQAFCDILQKYGIVEDDKWIMVDNGGEHWLSGIDKENPRSHLEIRRFRHPGEIRRNEG